MDWPTATVAVAAALGTSAVAIYSIRHQRDQAEKDRAHDTEMRRQERRSSAYIEMMTALERQQMQVDRTAPFFVVGVPPDPPPPFTDEELWRLNTLAKVLASDALREQILAWTRQQAQFFNEVFLLRQVQQDPGPPSKTKETYGVLSSEQWTKVDAARKALMEGLDAIGEQIRAEL